MKALAIGAVVIALFSLLIGGWISGSYNAMVQQNETVDTAWAQVETQYQRRFDLVPNLVNATKGFMAQEKEVFDSIAEARTRYAGTNPGSEERVQATGQYESALSRLLVVMENYPQLRSIETVRALTDELAGTENRIAVSRDRYNEQVRVWNTDIKRFPRNILAGLFGFDERELFQSTEGADKAPTVDLTN